LGQTSKEGKHSLRLNPSQTEAVEWCDGHELVLAGAGSGKTRVLAAKIAYLINEKRVRPHRILAVTFTNKAASEMLERVNSLVGSELRGMQISTFHSFGLYFLRRNGDALGSLGYPKNVSVFDRGDCKAIIRRLLRENDAPKYSDYGDRDFSPLEVFSRAYAGCDPATLEPDIKERWRGLYDRYRAELASQGGLDFDDLMILPLHILMTREDILDEWRSRYEWVLVDEYQDVNRPQYLLLKLLVGNSSRIMAVGDPDQSIYGWRGSDMSLILRFGEDFHGARVLVLDQNYRSTANILEAANSVISRNENRPEKNLRTDSGEGHPIKVVKTMNDIGESEFIAKEIENLTLDGYRYGDISILYRMNALSRKYEETMLEHGIPYRIVRGVAFYERAEVKDIISVMRLSTNPRDRVSLDRIANIPPRGLGKKSVAEIAEYLAESEGEPGEIWAGMLRRPPLRGKAAAGASGLAGVMAGVCRSETLESAVNYILYNCGYSDYIYEKYPNDCEERLENAQELISVASGEGSVAEALAEVALFSDQRSLDSGGACVNLLTLHAAKGLEFPVVFMPGLEEGIFPTSRAQYDPDAMEEERRLCYVGMTRARERLYMSGAMSRFIFGEYRREPFSRFFGELPDAVEIDDRTKKGGGFFVHSGVNRRGQLR
jgi:DNA helicase-2/ATP-dependent DNA helicase PcrA